MTYKTKAIVLKSKAWPRNARLYILYTEKFGKVKGVAAGSQKITSKVAGHLQPFSLVEVMMAQGRRIDRLAQGRFLRGFPAFGADFSSLARGSYILEIIDVLTSEGVADRELWAMIEELFDEFNERNLWGDDWHDPHREKQAEVLIRLFALRLLDRFGYRPELYACVRCRGAVSPEAVSFSVIQGGVLCAACRREETSVAVPSSFITYLRSAMQKPLSEAARIVADAGIQDLTIASVDQMVMMQVQRPLKTLPYLSAGNTQAAVL